MHLWSSGQKEKPKKDKIASNIVDARIAEKVNTNGRRDDGGGGLMMVDGSRDDGERRVVLILLRRGG